MAKAKNETPKSYKKSEAGQTVAFKQQSRFGSQGGFGNVSRSQYKPMPVRITQHKG